MVVFDYDRDGDLDFHITVGEGHPNFLYRNEGDATFVNVAEAAGVAAVESHGSGAVACDLDNDGYQDLYVGARGVTGKRVDYRSALGDDDVARQLREAIKDRLFVNGRDGTFTDITDSAFGDDVNLRSASSIACADVDGDGWLDIYVGNLITEDFFSFDQASHPGHYNVLYLNNGDLTFRETADSAGVRGPEVTMRDPLGRTLLFEDPETGEIYEGYDPTARDASGNRIGDPTGRTHAVLFLDYDDDGDPDLWVANDGDRLHVFRNESSPGEVRFTPVARAMGIDKVGNWMGFAVGDYDGDADLDLFVTNLGYHPFTRPTWEEPGGDCAYHGRFAWGQCANSLLRNDGTRGSPALDLLNLFEDVALDIQDFDYSSLDPRDPGVPARLREFRIKLHENGKGLAHGDFNGDGYAQIPHLDKRRTSLAPATKGAKMFLDQEKRSPTRCSYYEARLTGIPVRAGEGLDRYDGTVRPDDVRGVDASSGFEVIGRAPRETAGERSGLDGQPDDHLADAAELGRRRVGVRP